MKKMTNAVGLVLLLTFFFIACKKDDKKTTAQKIEGTWKIDSDVTHAFVNNVHYYDTTFAEPGSTIEFRKDGKVYSIYQNSKDTSTYSLSGDTKIIIDDEPYDIKTLNSNTFEISTKEVQGQNYAEEILKLVR